MASVHIFLVEVNLSDLKQKMRLLLIWKEEKFVTKATLDRLVLVELSQTRIKRVTYQGLSVWNMSEVGIICLDCMVYVID